jgi:hypothetical protein
MAEEENRYPEYFSWQHFNQIVISRLCSRQTDNSDTLHSCTYPESRYKTKWLLCRLNLSNNVQSHFALKDSFILPLNTRKQATVSKSCRHLKKEISVANPNLQMIVLVEELWWFNRLNIRMLLDMKDTSLSFKQCFSHSGNKPRVHKG